MDTHEIVGMIAPRELFIMENPHIAWLAAKSGSVAALGAQSNISYCSDVQDATHCAVRQGTTGQGMTVTSCAAS